MNREIVQQAQRLVIKIGSALLTDDGRRLNVELITQFVAQIAQLRAQGREVVVVSSGAVAAGLTRMGLTERPDCLTDLQAMAAIGQMRLVQSWETAFAQHDLHTAQVLLTHSDIKSRRRYLNARGTLLALLDMGVIPIVNENDTVANDEMRLGDNDTLAGSVVNLVEADALIILTDQQGMYDSDPRNNPSAKLLSELSVDDPTLMGMAGGSAGALGRGGMRTKVLAAQRAAYSGAITLIAGGREPDVLSRVTEGELLGTLFLPTDKSVTARKRWIAAQSAGTGKLHCDDGAVKALQLGGKSLLAAGLQRVSGRFKRGDCVACVDASGIEIAVGLSNYSAEEAKRLCGVASDDITQVLGYAGAPELIHRDNLLVHQV